MDLEQVRKKLPRSWVFDFDLDTLHVRADGAVCLRHHGGITVPVVEREGYLTLDAPEEVLAEVRRCFPSDAEAIIKDLRYHSGHWSFVRWGMYVGIDLMRDGTVYIHS
jgi:hypothetical protein